MSLSLRESRASAQEIIFPDQVSWALLTAEEPPWLKLSKLEARGTSEVYPSGLWDGVETRHRLGSVALDFLAGDEMGWDATSRDEMSVVP